MQLFYNPNIDGSQSIFTFPKEESKHIVRVLRKKVGDTVLVTDGKGSGYTSQIVDASNSTCTIELRSKQKQDPSLYQLHLAIAPTKLNDRFEWFLEKATEIGINEITPILCDHSERKVIKRERFEKLVQSAMKQSLRYYLPKLNKLCTYNDFIANQTNKSNLYIAHCLDTPKIKISELPLKKRYTVLIGPEGDFSEDEIAKAFKQGFNALSLGTYRLRTETAAIVCCQNFSFIHQ